MPRVHSPLAVVLILLLAGACLPAVLLAQAPATAAVPVDANVSKELGIPDVAAVSFRAQQLFEVRAPIGSMSVADRAKAIEARLDAAFAQEDLSAAGLRFENVAESTDVFLGNQFITSVTDADALPRGRTRRQLAADYGVILQRTVRKDLEGRSARNLIFGIIWSIVGILLAVAIVLGLGRLFARLGKMVDRLARLKISVIQFAGFTVFSPELAIPLAVRALRVLHWLLALIVIFLAFEFVMGKFPWTQGIAVTMTKAGVSAIKWAVGGLVSFLPNVLYITVIVISTRYLLKGLRLVLDRWGATAEHERFPQEWVRPTYQIVQFLVIALALVVAFPYLPGSGSQAFQGVSVFVGLLLSLGSTAAIANIVAGIVLTYMRALVPGDRVKVADTVGDVISCELLALRIKTIKNVEIAIPNAIVLGSPVINFSRQARKGELILHTTITIGYDVEWRKVHELMIAAALATPDIEPEPKPFVLQTSLDDFYVSYEINAFTKNAAAMAQIYADLHANIQDKFNEGGVEIMSPHYAAVRDGGRTAVPDPYLPKDYRAPAFGLSWPARRP
ncbi:MAG: mechanosensitive ion channel domain-containing protein [Gammaproteobacteria bacterium]